MQATGGLVQHRIATTLFFDSFYFYISVKNNAAAMLNVMGKFKKRQRHSGQTREPPKIFCDSS